MTGESTFRSGAEAVGFLRQQHNEIRSLLETVSRTTGEMRREAFEPLVRLLAVHETAEEMVVHPALRASGAEGARITAARLTEEDRAKKELARLESLDPDSAEFTSAFTRFRSMVEEHAELEEQESFPLLERVKDADQLRRMRTALVAAEAVAPTHAHRAAPESRIGNVVTGPAVAMIDRTRDAIRSVLD